MSTTSSFRTSVGTFLGTREDLTVTGDAPQVGGWENWLVERLDDTHVAIRSYFGRYLSALSPESSYSVIADREAVGEWETWAVSHDDVGHASLRSYWGRYLCYDPEQGLVHADREVPGPWETFEVTPWWTPVTALPQTTLQVSSGTFLRANENYTVDGEATEAQSWETWGIESVREGVVAIKSCWGRYLTADLTRGVLADRPVRGGWEEWTVERLDDTHVAFKSWDGFYLCFDETLRQLVANREALGPWETFGVTPWWQAPLVNPLVGPITADYDGGTRDSTGCRLMLVLHAGDLLARFHYERAWAEALLDEIAAAGWQAVRTWTILRGSYWEGWGMVLTADLDWYWPNLREFCDALKTRGLRWLVSQGDLCAWVGQSQRKDFMHQLAGELRDQGGNEAIMFGVDAGNETAWNGEGDPQALREVLDAFLAVLDTPIRTLTSWDEEHPNEFLVGDVQRDLHTGRHPWPMSARRVFNVGYETQPHVFTMYSEPAGQGVQEYAGDVRVGHHVSATAVPAEWNDGDPEIQLAYAAIHAIAKGQFVCFMSPGVITDERFTNYKAFTLVPRLYGMLPPDLPSWWTFHGGENRAFSADRILAVPANDALDVRCDHAASPSGPGRLCVAYGPAGSYDLRVVNHFTGRVIDLSALETVEVAWLANDVVNFGWKRGVVLVGEIGGATSLAAPTATASLGHRFTGGRGFRPVPRRAGG